MTVSTGRTSESVEDIQQVLRGFLETRTGVTWALDTDLFAEGGLSSLFAMELVVKLEQSFGVVIAGADLRLDNFRTIDAMAELVTRLRAVKGDSDG
jgi:methoxymalonate biosynthesis acyl carrier protein